MSIMTDTTNFFKIPKEILFPDELNRYLKEQIMGFTYENEMLRKNLEQFTEKISELQTSNLELKNRLKEDQIGPQNMSNSKIVELSKNFREKCAELEKYKTKYSKLVKQFEELKICDKEETKNYSEDAAKQLQEKLNSATNKIFEYKNTNLELKNELKKNKKLLEEADNNNKQILSELQEKTKKLKLFKSINNNQGKDIIKNVEKPKISTLESEISELKTQNQALKIKNEALKARTSVLEIQMQDYKTKLQIVEEKCLKEHLNVIENLSKALSETEHVKKCLIKDKYCEINNLKKNNEDLKEQIDNYKKLIKNFKDQKPNTSLNSNNEEKQQLLDLIQQQTKKIDCERTNLDKFQQLLLQEKQKTIKLEALVALDTARTRNSYTSSQKHDEIDWKNQLELAQEQIKGLQIRLQLEQNERKKDFQEFSQILLNKTV